MSASGKWAITIGIVSVALVLALYLSQTDLTSERNFLPRCTLNTWTGLHCPGCGNTRASQALLRGDVPGAIQQNVLLVVALPFLLIGGVRSWVGWMFPGCLRPLGFRWKWGYSLFLIGIILVFSILRNVPAKPWSWLAPVSLTDSPFQDPAAPGPGNPPH